jgi:tripartite-type tricarboxylate transporter receptor subunit TctC
MTIDRHTAAGTRRSLSLKLAAVLATLGLVVPALLPGAAQAQDFPTRPVKMVVPFGPGTTTDIISRVVAEGLAKPLGQTVVVENRSGAGGSIGSDVVAKAAPDGYTLVMGTVGTHAINTTLYRRLPYDVLKDFVPIAFIGYTPTLLVVAADSPLKSLKDVADQARKPGGVSFASAGNGTSGHLAGELLKAKLGGEIVHVPYKEGGLAMSDVMSGQVHFMFYHPAAVMPHIRSGRLRALGASGVQRSSAAPEVAPIAEQGYPDFDLVAWFMLYAPAATPAPVVARLREAADQALGSAEVKGKLGAQGVEMRSMKGGQLAEFGRAEIGKWSELVKRSGAQID